MTTATKTTVHLPSAQTVWSDPAPFRDGGVLMSSAEGCAYMVTGNDSEGWTLERVSDGWTWDRANLNYHGLTLMSAQTMAERASANDRGDRVLPRYYVPTYVEDQV